MHHQAGEGGRRGCRGRRIAGSGTRKEETAVCAASVLRSQEKTGDMAAHGSLLLRLPVDAVWREGGREGGREVRGEVLGTYSKLVFAWPGVLDAALQGTRHALRCLLISSSSGWDGVVKRTSGRNACAPVHMYS